MSQLHIALMPGDGIGPEVTDAAVRVLQALEAQSDDLVLQFETLSVGAGEYLSSGDPLPAAALERARACDAVLLGAMGLPDVRWPNGTEMAPQIDIREQLDLYQGIRPVHLYHEALTPLRDKRAGQIDLVIYRRTPKVCSGSAKPATIRRQTTSRTRCAFRAVAASASCKRPLRPLASGAAR